MLTCKFRKCTLLLYNFKPGLSKDFRVGSILDEFENICHVFNTLIAFVQKLSI